VSDLEQIVAIVAGYAFALVGGYLYLTKVAEVLWSLDDDRGPRYLPQLSGVVGLVERTLYLTAFLLSWPAFIALWLVMKIAADWKSERHWGEAPRLTYAAFFVGSGLSLLYAVAGWYIIRLGTESAWLGATGATVALLIGSEGLRQLLLYHRKKIQGPSGGDAAVEAVAPSAAVIAGAIEVPPEPQPEAETESESTPEAAPEPADPVEAPGAEEPAQAEVAAEETEAPEEPPLPEVTIPTAPPPRSRRTPEEIVSQAERVRAAVRANPGQGVAEISKTLGATTTELRRPVELLLAGKMLRKTGEGRQTQYFPGPSRRQKVTRVATNSKKKKATRRKKRR